MKFNFKEIVGMGTSILALTNSFILIQNYLTNKPKLITRLTHNHVWWTKLPDTVIDDKKVATYGFILYINVLNKGKRRVAIDTWNLELKTIMGEKVRLNRLPIPMAIQPLKDGSSVAYSILGHPNEVDDGSLMVESGDCITGLSFFAERFFVESQITPVFNIEDNKIKAKLIVKDVFGKKSTKKFWLAYKDFDEINKIMPNLDKAMYKG